MRRLTSKWLEEAFSVEIRVEGCVPVCSTNGRNGFHMGEQRLSSKKITGAHSFDRRNVQWEIC